MFPPQKLIFAWNLLTELKVKPHKHKYTTDMHKQAHDNNHKQDRHKITNKPKVIRVMWDSGVIVLFIMVVVVWGQLFETKRKKEIQRIDDSRVSVRFCDPSNKPDPTQN